MQHKENLPTIDKFETMIMILSYCTKQWRASKDVAEYMGLHERTTQRYVKNLIDYGYMERKGFLVAATPKAITMLSNGTFQQCT
jgi:DNA-binding IclR family transcriptional regulator